MPGESWRSGELARALDKRTVEVDRIGDTAIATGFPARRRGRCAPEGRTGRTRDEAE